MTEPHVEVLMRYYYQDEALMRSEMGRSIASLNDQTYKNLSVTFCRDGGISARDLIGERCEVDYREIGSATNLGRGFATNCLLSVLGGEYFALLDSDDFMEPSFIEKCVEMAVTHKLVMVKPRVKLVYFRVAREKIDLFEMYFRQLVEMGDEYYKGIFGEDSIRIFPEGLQMISKMFHRCLATLPTKSALNITEDCYWMYKANRILKELGMKAMSYVPAPGEHYIQVHPSNRMERYEVLGLKMKAEDHYELPTRKEVMGVHDALADGV